jgi:FKBP-type peptidyl-prolyl cis-trans isomerase FklB
MKRSLVIIMCIMLAAGTAVAEKKQALTTQKEKLSYAIGIDMGTSLKKNDIDVDPAILFRGIKDALSGGKQLMTEQELKDTIQAAQKELMAKQLEKRKVEAEKNKKEGEAFLEANKKKKGVKILPDGLQYKVITEGKGQMPKATDTVTVNYKGTLIDGTEFDSSYKRKEPATFPVTGVIKGWTEALQMMRVGSKWELFVPADLAYGERGTMGGPIGPNAVLIFEVELLSIKPAATK